MNKQTIIGIVIVICIVIVAGLYFFGAWQKKGIDVTVRLQITRDKLQLALNERLSLIDSLVSYVGDHYKTVDQSNFDTFASSLLDDRTDIRSVQLAPNAVVTYIHPLEGNEAAQGHDLLGDPNRREAVQRAIDDRTFVVAGPVALRQGGAAIIARNPIFVPDGTDGERFWGLAIILVDFESLLAEAQIPDPSGTVEYALRGKDAKGAKGDVFFGEPALFEAEDVQILDITLPAGLWQIAAIKGKK